MRVAKRNPAGIDAARALRCRSTSLEARARGADVGATRAERARLRARSFAPAPRTRRALQPRARWRLRDLAPGPHAAADQGGAIGSTSVGTSRQARPRRESALALRSADDDGSATRSGDAAGRRIPRLRLDQRAVLDFGSAPRRLVRADCRLVEHERRLCASGSGAQCVRGCGMRGFTCSPRSAWRECVDIERATVPGGP